jgi:hypothetical protein
MGEHDKVIILDTKGDYLRFYRDCDLVISIREDEARKLGRALTYERWNVMNEVKLEDEEHKEETANEISRSLFDPYSHSVQNPFFPSAARQITLAAIMALLHRDSNPDNASLKEVLASPKDMILTDVIENMSKLMDNYPSMKWILRHIDPSASVQALGVLGEIAIMVGDLFSGNYGKPGKFSIRNFVRGEGDGKVLFIEYDIGVGKTLTPIYGIQLDMAIKETLSRSKGSGNVYFVLDEFGRLPNLQQIEAGINYGRELGARFVVGTQTVGQILSAYGRGTGESIMSGFGTTFAFNLFDQASRSYVSGRYGSLRKLISYKPSESEGIKNYPVDGKMIEDWHISRLGLGEAIACVLKEYPRKIKFRQYEQTKHLPTGNP